MINKVHRGPMLLALTAIAAALCSAAALAVPLSDGFDLGRGHDGEFCEARRGATDPAIKGLFNASYTMRCRGWTDTLWVGELHVFQSNKAAPTLEKAIDARLQCGAPGPVAIAGVSKAIGRRCRDRESGRNALVLTTASGGGLAAVVGLEPFADNLAGGLRQMLGKSAGNQDIDLAGLAPPPPRAAADAAFVGSAAAFDRQDVRTYSARGQFGDARELANTYLSKLPADASQADKIDLRLDAALSESNLAYGEASAQLLDDAQALLAAAGAPQGPAGELLRLKYLVYRANDSLNRRDYAAALGQAEAALAVRSSDTGNSAAPLRDPVVLRRLNAARTAGAAGAIALDDPETAREAQLRTLALFVRGGSLAGLGQLAEADKALGDAQNELAGTGLTSIEAVKLAWLVSSIAAERGRLAEERGDTALATENFTRSVAALEASTLYRDSPLLAQRRIGMANFLRRGGNAPAAKEQFALALATLEAVGPSAAAGITGLDGYFDLLAAEAADASGAGAVAGKAAAAAFFRAAQFINPPALTAQIAAMKKIYESGDAAGAARARALEDLGRERRALATRISGLPSGADADRLKLQGDLAVIEARSAEVTSELAADQQYLRANDSAVELAEIQAALHPREALLKIVWLARRSYALVATRDNAIVYPLGKSSAEITDAVAAVRTSIDGDRVGTKVQLTDFDVDNARLLDTALLGPAASLLAGVDALIVDAAGPFNQMPLAVLIRDDASIARFNITARQNALDYTGINFLGSAFDLSTTVSPRAFLVARQQRPSLAEKPYLGFGDPEQVSPAVMSSLGNRGVFKRCTGNLTEIAQALHDLVSISPAELDAGVKAMGPGSQKITQAAFSDAVLNNQNKLPVPPFQQFQVVHFATHGLKENEIGCDSPPALVTSTAPGLDSDGLLSFEEIAALKLDANLVILSACNTAAEASGKRARELGFRVGEAGQGATLNGLVRAFFNANSRAVLTTHWAVPNDVKTRGGGTLQPSTLLMEQLFANSRDHSIAGAVRAAQTKVRANPDLSHPYYWGAFTVVGDGSKTMLTPTGATADARR